MQNLKPFSVAMVALASGAISLGGCATKGFVRDQVGVVDAGVRNVDARVRDHDTHLGKLDRTAQDALDRAQAAGKLAEGKILYAMVLSDDDGAVGRLGKVPGQSREAFARGADPVAGLRAEAQG